MDPVESVDALGVFIRCHRFHAVDFLEAEVISYESHLSGGLYRAGGLFDQRHHELLREQNCTAGSHLHTGHLLGSDVVCVPDEI